jgi:hypothetical protein
MNAAAEPDPTSLERLQDIVVPAPVSAWPTSPGWIVLALLLVAMATVAMMRRRRMRRNARYRLDALEELGRLREAERTLPSDLVAGRLLVLLRRTALSVHPRRELASLSGSAWWEFLDEMDGREGFSQGRGARLEALAYGAATIIEADELCSDLIPAVEAWIRGHRVPLRPARGEPGQAVG